MRVRVRGPSCMKHLEFGSQSSPQGLAWAGTTIPAGAHGQRGLGNTTVTTDTSSSPLARCQLLTSIIISNISTNCCTSSYCCPCRSIAANNNNSSKHQQQQKQPQQQQQTATKAPSSQSSSQSIYIYIYIYIYITIGIFMLVITIIIIIIISRRA